LVKKADSAYYFKEWGKKDDPLKIDLYKKAKSLYAKVLSEYPGNRYCKNRILEIDRILSDFKNKPHYTKAISIADSLYKKYEFKEARNAYIKTDSFLSLVIDKNDKTLIKSRIAICNDAIKIGVVDSSIAFIKSVYNADNLFVRFEIDNARDFYNEVILDSSYTSYAKAISLYDKSVYAKEKIDKIKKIKSNHIPSFFYELLRRFDSLYQHQQYEEALKGYIYLLKFKPKDNYIIKMIEKCKNKLK